MNQNGTSTGGATVEEWMRGLAAANGSPGGGAASGVMLAAAAALTSMVAGYTEPSDDLPAAELEALSGRAESLRTTALELADGDAAASAAFGRAFRMPKRSDAETAARADAIRTASVEAARASATLGEHAIDAIDDLALLARHGNRALIADVVVGFGALRAALTGARTNVSFDLAATHAAGDGLDAVREQHPHLWRTVARFDDALARIDAVTASVDDRAAPTDA